MICAGESPYQLSPSASDRDFNYYIIIVRAMLFECIFKSNRDLNCATNALRTEKNKVNYENKT